MHAIKGILDKGMKKIVTIFALLGTLLSAEAQNTLSLDSCRAMALRNNKQINVSRLKKDVAYNLRKSARIQYLPKVDAMGGYEWFSREISLLNKGQSQLAKNVENMIDIFLMMLMLRAVSFLPSSSPKMSIMFSTFFANWL